MVKILITLTTEGGSREDGNVYYADHLLCAVNANRFELDKQEILGLIAKYTHGEFKLESNMVMCPQFIEDDGDNEEFDAEKLAIVLSDAGWPTEQIVEWYVVQDENYQSQP